MTEPKRTALRPAILVGIAVVAAGALGAAALYGRGDAGNGEAVAGCSATPALSARLKPLARGEVAAVRVASAPQPLPPLSFNGPDGTPKTMADFKGRTVLLNLWATWCVPCRKEMPALDALAAKLGGPQFEVVAVNMDARNPDKPKSWLKENNITGLAYYADPSGKVFQELRSAGRATGLPTTVLVGKDGCLLANLDGPAEWASEDALALIRAALSPPLPRKSGSPDLRIDLPISGKPEISGERSPRSGG